MRGGIYIYYFFGDKRKSYIGSTINFKKRKREHTNDLRNNDDSIKFQRAYNKYGHKNMIYEEIEEIKFPRDYSKQLIKEHLECREAYWQRYYTSRYIVVIAGEYDIIKKITLIGKSQYHQDIKEGKRNKPYKPTARRPINCYTLEGEFIKQYSHAEKIADELGYGRTYINKIAGGKGDRVGKYIFRYEGVPLPIIPIKENAERRKMVFCYKNGLFFKEYKSIASAARDFEMHPGNMKRYCNTNNIVRNEYTFSLCDNTLLIGKSIEDLHEENKKKCIPLRKFYGERAVKCYSKDGSFLKNYSSIINASRELDVLNGNISACCKGKLRQVKGYIFEYL